MLRFTVCGYQGFTALRRVESWRWLVCYEMVYDTNWQYINAEEELSFVPCCGEGRCDMFFRREGIE